MTRLSIRELNQNFYEANSPVRLASVVASMGEVTKKELNAPTTNTFTPKQP